MGKIVPLKTKMTSLSTETERCPYCGKEKVPKTTDFLGTKITVTLACACEIKAYEKDMDRLKQHEKYERQRLMHKKSGLDNAVNMTFDNFKPRPGTEQALQVARKFVNDWEQNLETGEGFTFAGDYGNGKSHLVAAVVHELVDRDISATYQPVAELLKRVRATFGSGAKETEAQILDWLFSVKCLALDDIGAQKETDWAKEFLLTVIDFRYRRKLPILVTTNCIGEDDLTKSLGGRAMDRLIERNVFVKVKADSYRREIAKKRMMELNGD